MIFRLLLLITLSLYAGAGWAQLQTQRIGGILVLDQQSLLTRSRLGQDILNLELAEQEALLSASRLVTQALQAEEAELTQLRLTMENPDFRALADAFNEKVEATRASQIANDEAQLSRVETRRRAFFQFIVPQLGELIQKYGAAAIIDRRSVLLFDKNLDITQEIIALLDTAYAQNPDMIDLGN